MHELAAVASLVEQLLERLGDREPGALERLRVRRGSDFSEEALIQGFEALSRGTVLEGARLEIEVAEVRASCACGQTSLVTADDLIGHMLVCPSCGSVRDAPATPELEVLELVPRHPTWSGPQPG